MAEPTEENITGVESFDHRKVADLVEYQEACRALDALVKAINRAEREVGQAAWLKMVEQMGALLSYSDSSGHPHNGCPHEHDGTWPFEADVSDGTLNGQYRCPYCDSAWTVGYDVNISKWI